ncbi:MAG: hypothetical protein KOO63_08135 [Bacteroidales bacterium]|nr:hypothetical protein [Candidatus Latescibacterota bacterium]
MATDTLTLNSGSGGSDLSVNDLADGTKCQNIKILSAEDQSETQIYAGHGVAAQGLRVELPTDGTGVVGLNTGTNSVGTVGLNTGTNSVGTIGLDAGAEAIGSVQSAGAVAHDAVGTSILPLLGGAIAYETDGTTPGTAVAEGDITYLKASRDGQLLTCGYHPASGTAENNSSAAETATVLAAQPASGFCIYLDWVAISSLTAQTTKLHDEDDTVVIPLQYTGANGNVMIQCNPPIKLVAVKALEYTTTAAVATSIAIGYHVAP